MEVLRNFFVPKRYVSLAVIGNGAQDGFASEVRHEVFHAFNAFDEVNHLVFIPLFIEGTDDIVNGLAQNSRQTNTHGGMSERILVVATVCRPRRVVWVDLKSSWS